MIGITTDVLMIDTRPAGSSTAALLASYSVNTLITTRYGWLAKTPRAHITNQCTMKVMQDRSGPKANKRVKFLVDSLVKHMHAFVKEARPAKDQWMYGTNYLTRTGRLSTEWRQEFILLSDVLGVSMLVETPNHGKMSGETELTVLGPSHIAHAPQYQNGANICLDGKDESVYVHGKLTNSKGKTIEVPSWMCGKPTKMVFTMCSRKAFNLI